MKDVPVATTEHFPMAAATAKAIEQEVWVVLSDSSGGEDESEPRGGSQVNGEDLALHVARSQRRVAHFEWWTGLLLQLSPHNLHGPSMLHCDVRRFCQTLEATPLEQEVRAGGVHDLRRVISQLWPRSTVWVHGSTATALCLPSSDIDLALDTGMGPLSTSQWQHQLRNHLQRSRLALSIHAIPKAKVPILKLVLRGSNLRVDISCLCFNGPKAVPWVCNQIKRHPPLRPLLLLLKCYLGQRGWNEPFSGGMGSYCLLLMLIAHLEAMQREAGGQIQWADMGRILVSFLIYFGRVFDYRTDVVTLSDRPLLSKRERGWEKSTAPLCLAVEDPQSGTNSGGATYRMEEIRRGFASTGGELVRLWGRVGLPVLLDVNRPRGQMAACLQGDSRNHTPPSRPTRKGGGQNGREPKRKEAKGRQQARQGRGGGGGAAGYNDKQLSRANSGASRPTLWK